MAEEKKRGRSSNFTGGEIEILLECVGEQQDVIQCKKTDAVTWQQKEKAWDEVAATFNARSGTTFRAKKMLKAKYDDMKKQLKKKLADNRVETFKTGGGQPLNKPLSELEQQLLGMMPSTVEGLTAVWDSDAAIAGTSHQQHSAAFQLNRGSNKKLDFPCTSAEAAYMEETAEAPYMEETAEAPYMEETADAAHMETAELLNNYVQMDPLEEPEIIENEHRISMLRKKPSVPLQTRKRKGTVESPLFGDDDKKQVHGMRIKILQKELEIKEQQLKIEAEANELKLKILKTELEIKENLKYAELEIHATNLKLLEVQLAKEMDGK